MNELPSHPKITAEHFYEKYPAGTHSTGDIWRGLPIFGNLNRNTVTGVVITPACDLDQHKTETITFLPIITIKEYISSPSFYSDTWKYANDAINQLKLSDLVTTPNRFELPIASEIDQVITAAKAIEKPNTGNLKSIAKLIAYRNVIKSISSKNALKLCDVEQTLTTDKFEELLGDIVKNKHKVDIHFLPADGKPKDYSAIPESSLVLFRYPTTIPVSMLDHAQISDQASWEKLSCKLASEEPISKHFSEWPLKLTRLKDDFLSDMLSRYLSMFIRMGSRDFTADSVSMFVKQLKD